MTIKPKEIGSNTIERSYKGRYLSLRLVDKCFRENQHTFVDKVVTGNGFTYSYLRLPVEHNKTNLIIVPNREVVISKKEAYDRDIANGITPKNRIGFIFGSDSSDTLDFDKFDVIMFVADSFLLLKEQILFLFPRIGRILIDECHTMAIQSVFRYLLRGFVPMILEEFKGKTIVSVTATPMLFQEADIRLVPNNIDKRVINISTNQEKTLKTLIQKLNNNENCVVALQNANILRKLTDKDNVLTASIKTGKVLYQRILESVTLIDDKESNLTIISSAGFEGFDVENGINNVFIFEDRSYDYQTFYTQNVVQIIGRPRQGTSHIEWCRLDNANRKAIKEREEIQKKIDSERISLEKKLYDPNYRYVAKYCVKAQDMELGLITKLEIDDVLYSLDKELADADIDGLSMYDKFFETRGFTINNLNNGRSRMKSRGVRHSVAHKNVLINKEIVQKGCYFDDIHLDLYSKEKLKDYKYAYEIYLRRKYWYLEELPWSDAVDLDDIDNVQAFKNELLCLDMISDADDVKRRSLDILKKAKKRKKEVICPKSNEYKTWLEKNVLAMENVFPKLLMALSQEKIRVPSKIRGSRDFNLTTEVSINIVNDIAQLFDTQMVEKDIVSCNIRIIYAFCGLLLPENFYGENKKNKKAINSLLNKISKYHPEDYKFDVQKWKENRIDEMKGFSFDKKVIKFLIDTFWEKEKDAVYNFCAYHEMKLLGKLTQQLIYKVEAFDLNTRFIRRHDSILVFGEYHDSFNEVINNFVYLNTNKWFDKTEGFKDEFVDFWEMDKMVIKNKVNDPVVDALIQKQVQDIEKSVYDEDEKERLIEYVKKNEVYEEDKGKVVTTEELPTWLISSFDNKKDVLDQEEEVVVEPKKESDFKYGDEYMYNEVKDEPETVENKQLKMELKST